MAMKICPRCGNEVEEDALTCPFCGYVFEDEDTDTVKLESYSDFKDLAPLMGKIGEKYEVVRFIGKGGFSKVFLVRDKILDRKCALKVLSPEVMNDPEMLERFKREAKLYAALEHPNIVPIYDVGIYNNIAYIIMKYIEGRTLKNIIRNYGPLPLEDIIQITKDILSALHYMHNKGVIHRDIKPANVIVEKSTGRAILADFGLAKKVGETGGLTRTGEMLGTPFYVSPEQAKGEKLCPASDIYSLGISLFEMATGKVPFTGETPLQIMWKHVREPLPSPSKYNPKIPPMLESIILKATDKKPKNRYKSALEMKRDIDRLEFQIRGMRAFSTKESIISVRRVLPLVLILILLGGGYLFRNDLKRMAVRGFESAKNFIIGKIKTEQKKETVKPAESTENPVEGGASTEVQNKFDVSFSANAPSKLYVDGKYVGKIPPSITLSLDKGEHVAKFVSAYGVGLRKFTVSGDREKTNVYYRFRRSAIIKVIDSNPHAEIYIDGKFLGITRFENLKLSPGKHVIEIKRSGYIPVRREITLKEGETLEMLSFELKKLKGE